MQPRLAMLMTALMIGMSWSLMANSLDFQEQTPTTELAEPTNPVFAHGTGELISTTLDSRAVIWGDNITATINLSNLSSSVAYTVNWKVCLNNESTYDCTWPAQQWNGYGNGSFVNGNIMVQNGSTSLSTNVSFQTSLTAANATYGRNTTMSFKAIITTTNGSGSNASHSFLTLGVDGYSNYPVWSLNSSHGNPPYLMNGSTHDEYARISLMTATQRSGWTENVKFDFTWVVYNLAGSQASSGLASTIDTNTCDGSWLAGCSAGTSWGDNGATSLNSGNGFAAGQYSVYVTMSENSTGYTMLSWNTTFTVSSPPAPTGNLAAWTDYTSYTQGDTVYATISSWVSNLNETHYIDWELEDGSGGAADYGNFSWTSYTNSSFEYLNWSSLTPDTYCFNATLYSSNWTNLDNDYGCFTVVASPPAASANLAAWTDYTNYTQGDTVHATISSWVSNLNETYYLDWDLVDGSGNTADSNTYNWTANSNSSYEYLNWSTLSPSSYCLNATLYSPNMTLLDNDYTCFSIASPPAAWGTMSTWTDQTSYTQGDTVYGTIYSWVSNLNETYYLDWELVDGSGNSADSNTYNWTAYNNESYDYLNWSALSPASYCLTATLYSSNWTMIYNGSTCFTVTAPVVTGHVNTWTNYTNYTVGDMVTATTQSYILTYNATYSLVWNLTTATGVADSGIYNWTAMSNSSNEYEMWSTLSSGYYCINVDLYATSAMGNTHLDSDYSCFSMASPTGYIWVWTDYTTYTVGDTISATMQSYSLTMNSDYEMYYNLTDSSGSVDNGWYAWNANYSTSTEYESWSSLTSGNYCLNATLYDGNGNMFDSDTRCFTVSNPAATGSLYAWSDMSTYTVGDTVYLSMESYSLTYNASYSLYYELVLNGSSWGAGIHNWTAYSNSSTENVNWSTLIEGNYCLNATLRDATEDWSHHLDNYYFCFDVDAQPEPEGEIYVWTDSGEYDEDDTIIVTITAYGLMMNHSYQIGWHLNDSGIIINSGSEIFVSNGSYHYEFQLTNLSMSDYCIGVELDGGGASLIDQDMVCFDVDEVYNTGYVSAWWNHSSIMAGEDTIFNMEMSDLTNGTNYRLEMLLTDDEGNQLDFNVFVWFANSMTSSRFVTWDNVPAGEYCANVTLYLNDTNEYLDDEYTCFWVQYETPDGDIGINMDNETWYIGRPDASATIEISGLESNTNYSYSWSVENETGHSIWAHSMNFSSNNSMMVTVDFVDYGGLDEGHYCLFATIYDGEENYIDSDGFCFSVEELVPMGRLSVYLNGSMFETGDSIGGTFEYEEMSAEFDYRIDWSIDGLANSSGSGPLMSFQVASGHVYQYRDWVIDMEGEYCLNASLYGLIAHDDGTTTDYFLDNSGDCFSVYRPTPTGRLSLYSNSSYELNETVVVTFEYTNMSGDFHYQIEWLIDGVNGTDGSQILAPAQVASGHVYQYRDFLFNTSGEYCINATLLGLLDGASGDMVHLDDDLVCFLVGLVSDEPATPNREGDSDSDGVPDEWDNCADTPTGSMTDSNGCPPDVDAISEAVEDGALPGFTSMFGVLSLLGAAIAFRRKD